MTIESRWLPTLRDLCARIDKPPEEEWGSLTSYTIAVIVANLGELQKAINDVKTAYNELYAKKYLSDDELKQFGALGGLYLSLTNAELLESATPKSIFIYTMKSILPWLRLLVGFIVHAA